MLIEYSIAEIDLVLILLQDVFHERVKIFKNWKEAEQNLAKKREAKAKLELARKMDKVPAATAEITEVSCQTWPTAAEALNESGLLACRWQINKFFHLWFVPCVSVGAEGRQGPGGLWSDF